MEELGVVEEPDVVAVELSLLLGRRPDGRDRLEVREDGRVLDVDEEEKDEQGEAIGGECAAIWRVDLSVRWR